MGVGDRERYWTEELGEDVTIRRHETREEYMLSISGTHVSTYGHLRDLEKHLALYFMLKGE